MQLALLHGMHASRRRNTNSKTKTMSPTDAPAVRPRPPFPAQHQRRPGSEADITPRPEYLAQRYRAAGKLTGKVALITGGDSGIGRAVAVLFAREGARVVIAHLRGEERDARETQSVIEHEGGRCVRLTGDLKNAAFAARAVDRTIAAFGELDILVNNAAFQRHTSAIAELSHAQWEQTFRTNAFGTFAMTRAAVPRMPDGAAIINTGSITGLEGRPAQPDEIAPAFVFFASEADSGFITGEVLSILGGKTTAA